MHLFVALVLEVLLVVLARRDELLSLPLPSLVHALHLMDGPQ